MKMYLLIAILLFAGCTPDKNGGSENHVKQINLPAQAKTVIVDNGKIIVSIPLVGVLTYNQRGNLERTWEYPLSYGLIATADHYYYHDSLTITQMNKNFEGSPAAPLCGPCEPNGMAVYKNRIVFRTLERLDFFENDHFEYSLYPDMENSDKVGQLAINDKYLYMIYSSSIDVFKIDDNSKLKSIPLSGARSLAFNEGQLWVLTDDSIYLFDQEGIELKRFRFGTRLGDISYMFISNKTVYIAADKKILILKPF